MLSTGRQHHQPVEAERDTRAIGQAVVERGEDSRLQRPAQSVAPLLLVRVALPADGGGRRIGELAEGIAQLPATDIELEAFSNPRIAGLNGRPNVSTPVPR